MIVQIQIKRGTEHKPEFAHDAPSLDYALEYLFKLSRSKRFKEFLAEEPQENIPF